MGGCAPRERENQTTSQKKPTEVRQGNVSSQQTSMKVDHNQQNKNEKKHLNSPQMIPYSSNSPQPEFDEIRKTNCLKMTNLRFTQRSMIKIPTLRLPTCPISLEPMIDPVIAADNQTYERKFIEDWLEKNDTSPMTNQKLANKDLAPNYALRDMIETVKMAEKKMKLADFNNIIPPKKQSVKISQNSLSKKATTNITQSRSQTVDFPEGKYIGTLSSEKKREGSGKLIYKNMDIYTGQFHNDKCEGYGVMIYDNSHKKHYQSYSGHWKNGKWHGKGNLTYTTGQKYQGEFHNGLEHGYGIEIYPNQSRYEGYFNQGLRSGKGNLYEQNGDTYKGQWKNDKMQGYGELTGFDGSHYEGYLKDNKFHGKGKFKFIHGDIYEGDFIEGIIQGKGKMKYSDGAIYQGQFKDEMQHGKGICQWPNKQKYDGTWKQCLMDGYGTYYYYNGDKYQGGFKDDCREGKGVYYYSNGDRLEISYRNNLREGFGKYYYRDGRVQLREYQQGKLINRRQQEMPNIYKTPGNEKFKNEDFHQKQNQRQKQPQQQEKKSEKENPPPSNKSNQLNQLNQIANQNLNPKSKKQEEQEILKKMNYLRGTV